MKIPASLVLLLAAGSLAGAQTNDLEFDLSDTLAAAQAWATNNLDDDALRVLAGVDQARVRDFLDQVQAGLQGDSVPDVAQWQDAATTILPLLEAHEETRPYAAWLRERLDYFAVAGELQALTPSPPKPKPGQPAPLRPTVPYSTSQTVWVRQMAARPWPPGAAALVPGLKQIFLSEQVPPALVWLAEAESGFDRRARSPAGAVGLFQLMPATAKQYGLSLWPRDQRQQADPAAHAAARCLHQLQAQFGDWRLVLAAYNSGAGTVARLLERYHTTDFERIAPHLPAETQLYVPKVAAIIRHREGLDLASLTLPAPTPMNHETGQ